VNRTEQSTKTQSPRTGLFASLRAFPRTKGSGAPRRLALASLLATTAALALAAAPASAAAPPNLCPPGEGAGHCNSPQGVAVDSSTGSPTSGDLYVAAGNNQRVDVFDSAGNFLRAFGVGVLDGAPELQTCETACRQGIQGQPASIALRPESLAVDPASHDIYVSERGRVQEFTSSDKFRLMFGGGVLDGGATGTGDLTAGSTAVTNVAETSRDFAAGQTITAPGIPAGTRIAGLGVEQRDTIFLSQPATATASGVALTAPTPATNVPNNEVQTITLGGAPTGGTFSLGFVGLYGAESLGHPNLGGDVLATTASGSSKVTSVAEVESTANLTAGSTKINLSVPDGFAREIGEVVTGAGIPPGATIVGRDAAFLELSATATATASGVPLSFSGRGTANLTAGSDVITLTSAQLIIRENETVSGPGIPAGATIVAVRSRGTEIELSADVTVSGSGVAFTATPRGALEPGQTVSGPGIPPGDTVAALGSEGDFTLSAPATASGLLANLNVGVPFDASAAHLQSLLEAVPTIGAGNVAVSGAAGGPWTVEFKGRYADVNVPDLQTTSRFSTAGLTPSGTLTFATTTEGASAAEVCTAAEVEAGDLCDAGAPGGAGGQFSGNGHPLAFDSEGHLWVGDSERVEEFSESGAFLSEVAIPAVALGTEDAKRVGSLAVDSAGDFYVLNETESAEFAPGVRRYSPTGTLLETLDASGHPNALALDPAAGDLFVSDQSNLGCTRIEPACPAVQGPATLLSYDSSGTQTEAFGTGEVIGGPKGNALAFGNAAQRLFTVSGVSIEASNTPTYEPALQAFPLLEAGPLPYSGTSKADPIGKLTATLCSELNPEGASTTFHYQYIAAAKYEENEAEGHEGFTGALQTPESASIGSDFSPHPACQPISSLPPATAYRFRLVAHNANAKPVGVFGETASFETLAPAAIDSTSASDVTAESATLEAEINPLGEETHYRFEFLTQAQYEENEEVGEPLFTGASQAPAQPASLGQGNSDVAVHQHLQGLAAHTAYRYRAVALNVASEANGGPFGGPVHAFTTQAAVPAGLPDHRAWEQVSPPEKRGAAFEPIGEVGLIQAAASGDAIAYLASAPTEAEPQGNPFEVQVLSGRSAAGWASRDIAAPHDGPAEVTGLEGKEYRFFSTDLSRAVLSPTAAFAPQTSAAASEQGPYLRTDFPASEPTALCAESCYRPIVTGCPSLEAQEEGDECPAAVAAAADVPPGTKFGDEGKCPPVTFCGPQFLTATPDSSHLVVFSSAGLTAYPGDAGGIYEWSAAAPPSESLRLLDILPGGQPSKESLTATSESVARARNAISADGSRVFFAAGEHLYLRYNATEEPTASGECSGAEPQKACTIQLDLPEAGCAGCQAGKPLLQLATPDGSRLFFTDSGRLTANSGAEQGKPDLYECRIVEVAGELQCDLTDLTPESGGESAAVQGLVIGASEDGSYLYFVANGVLASNQGADGTHAAPGNCASGEESNSTLACNLYLRHAGTTTFLARLSGADQPSWGGFQGRLKGLTARVSPNGRWLAFMSQRPLTGYDNRDAKSGERDEEVFLYHASAAEGEAGKLVCASCNPTGARPLGVEYGSLPVGELVGGDRIWSASIWLAANLQGWTPPGESASYQSRYLSDQGRLFFNSSDALVPSDTNGQEDVYTYEPPSSAEEAPPNDTCATSSPTYSPAQEGCVSLISSGSSPEESAFLDASESGNDVFFLTSAQLAPTDVDTSLDLYDARAPHVPGEAVGFPEAAKPVECLGDACQQPATPPNDPTPGSLTFHGAGNVVEKPVEKKHKKHKKKSHGKHKKSHRAASHNRGGAK
jgi:hypothetical protein